MTGPTTEHPILAITAGDPGGVGPEITARVLAEAALWRRAHPVVVAPVRVLEAGAETAGVELSFRKAPSIDEAQFEAGTIDVIEPAHAPKSRFATGRPTPRGGELAYRQIVEAVEVVKITPGAALVTGPISKEALHMAGHDWPGHTELLAHLAGVGDVVMMLAAGSFRISFVTWHVSHREAPDLITRERIETTVRITADALARLGVARPRIAVAGLNPHAGEAGAFGTEEIETIAPAIEALRAEGLEASGPYPPDTVFLRARRGEFDAAVSMVHDHGHAAFKMVAFDRGVNVTLGLPFVRTSVDHGTAYDIAGAGRAEPESMKAAVRLAVRLASEGRGLRGEG
jgi:4-hydroxythreonine-4-phosphate dehydrogenase